jgi:cob(I)alamin adenosyltransferase
MKIYTKTGDSGETSLFGGGRVGKDALRVAAYGEVDELNAAIGVALATAPADLEAALLEGIQRDLFAVGGRLASPEPDRSPAIARKTVIPDDRIAALEAAIDRVDEQLPQLKAFILPGGALKAAHLHQARTVCRRAERAIVALHWADPVPGEILSYVNRLSDLLFMLARLANHRAKIADRTW